MCFRGLTPSPHHPHPAGDLGSCGWTTWPRPKFTPYFVLRGFSASVNEPLLPGLSASERASPQAVTVPIVRSLSLGRLCPLAQGLPPSGSQGTSFNRNAEVKRKV